MRLRVAAFATVILGACVVCGFLLLAAEIAPLNASVIISATVGIGAGFVLRHAVADIAGGLVLRFERFVSIGDYIEVEGVAGRIVKIGLSRTTLVTSDDIPIAVSNSMVFGSELRSLLKNGGLRSTSMADGCSCVGESCLGSPRLAVCLWNTKNGSLTIYWRGAS